MEPIPEDPEFGAKSPETKESRSVKREVYRSERVESTFRTVPQSYLEELDLQQEQGVSFESMDRRNGAYYVSSPGESVLPELSGTSYGYSYESSYDQPPVNGDSAYENGFSQNNVERHSTQTQKVTRVTKVTTTRQIQQIPTEIGERDDGGLEYVYNSQTAMYSDKDVNGDQSGLYALPPAEEGEQVERYGDYISQYALPSAPGVPQAVDVDSAEVTIVWLRPDRDGDMGEVEGYQVQFHKVGDTLWHPAHSGLIQDTQCTISNLDPNDEYQFRVVAKNSAGFGEPSTASSSVQLRPRYDGYGAIAPLESTAGAQSRPFRGEPGVPYPPGRPQVLAMDGSGVTLGWEQPIASGSGGPVAGYRVEYRTVSAPTWLVANDYLIPECEYTIRGLRPNGEYEFRVFARNGDGLSEPSQSSGPIKIRPQVPTRDTYFPSGAAHGANVPPPPSQPQVLDADSDSATLMWAPPPVPRGSAVSWQLIGYELECREIGDPNWVLGSQQLINGTQYIVRGLHPNSTYEFRVLARSVDGLSEPSEVSELVQLRPKMQGPPRGVPAKPTPPEIMESEGDQVTLCWLPAHSSLPVQGYDVEFRDLTDGSQQYLKVNDLLMQNCKMTIGELEIGRTYEFRVVAKNAMGYSEPSDPSEPLTVGVANSFSPSTSMRSQAPPLLQREQSYSSDANVPLQVELDRARESPPIPDRDDSPPPINRPFSGNDGVQWRDPTLPEVLDYLSSPNNVIRLNAAGYLQHLTYHDPQIKQKTRELNGIPKLVDLLSSDVPEIQKNACGCLKNLSYGRDNEGNREAIERAGGIPALTGLLRKTPDMQVKEEITGALWNLSSSDTLKRPILEHGMDPIVRQVIVPGSGWTPAGQNPDHPLRSYNPNVFRNGTGVIRNVSACGENARKSLREAKDLMDALVCYLHISVQTKAEYDTKAVENVVCVLRNLSYKCQEVEDPDYDKNPPVSARDPRSKSAPSGSPKQKSKKESKLFGGKKKSKDQVSNNSPHLKTQAQGVALLWQPEIVKDYLKLLSEANNPETLEATAGAIQNLTACYWQPSIDIRAAVRRERGLPMLVELLRIPSDPVNCAAATAMRNLALDPYNSELIGKYAIKDLVQTLPPHNRRPDRAVSEGTLCAVLGIMYEVVRRSVDFTRTLHEQGGTVRLVGIVSAPNMYSSRVLRYASQVLNKMWQYQELQELFRRSGFHDVQFAVRGRHPDTATLARPVSTQGPERMPSSRLRPDLDDSYSNPPHSAGYGSMGSSSSIPDRHRRDPGMRQHNGNGTHYPPQHGGHSQVPHPGQPEPLYAQVRKKNAQETPQHVLYERSPAQPAGDSWV